MPIQRLTWRDFSGGIWLKGPRENNAVGTLRRAKSVYPLRTGSIRSRSGIYQLSALAAHSLFKYAGKRIAGVGTTLYREVVGVFTAVSAGLGTGFTGSPLTFVSAPPTAGKQDYVFIAGGGDGSHALKKLNPALDTLTQWGLAPPAGTSPAAALGTLSAKEVDDFDTVANWALTDGTAKVASTTKKTEGTGSLQFDVAKDTEAKLDRRGSTANFADSGAATLDLSKFSVVTDSGDEDYIEIYVALSRPKHVKNIELTFYVGSEPVDLDDATDTYTREVTIRVVQPAKRRKLVGLGDLVRKKDQLKFIEEARQEVVSFSTAEFISEDKIAVTRRTWTRLTLPKSSFTANGGAGGSGKTWANVKAIRLSVETTKLGPTRVWFDRVQMVGGVGMQGDYQYMFTFWNEDTGTRSNPFPMTTATDTEPSIYDPVRIANVERHGVTLTGLPVPVDTQVTHIEIWRTVGNGTALFLAERKESTVGAPTTGYTDRIADYPGMFSGGGGTKFLQPEELPDDNARPDDAIQEIEVAFGRMWLARGVTAAQGNRVWYSGVGRLESVSSYVECGGTNEAVQRLVFWNETLVAFTQRGLYRLLGTDEPFVFVKLAGAPGTRLPYSVCATDQGIVYQATDGMRIYDGNSCEMLGEDALAPIFRGGASDGIAAFSLPVASVFGRDEYYVSDAATTLAYSATSGWRNVGVPCKAFFWETDTRVLLAAATVATTTRIVSLEGDVNGEVGGLVGETTTDVSTTKLQSDFEVETGGTLKGAGVWGTAQRIYIEGQAEGMTLAVSLLLDNVAVSVGSVTLAVGVRQVMELAVQRSGWITGVRVTVASSSEGATLSKRIEISAIEVDVYVP